MTKFPLKLPDGFQDKINILIAIVHRVSGEEILQLMKRLKELRTKAFKRATGWRSVGAEYAKSCECCSGTGQYHYCINPYCGSRNALEQDDCLHFTPDELETYRIIHTEYVVLLMEAVDVIKTGINLESLLGDQPRCAHEMN